MSTSSSIPATPTPGHGGEDSLDSDVFSSPARGVGWSPSTASAPLGLLDNGDLPNYNLIIDANISPVYQSSLRKIPPKDGTRTVAASNCDQPVFEHETNLTAEGVAIPCPPQPPSTPRTESLAQEAETHGRTSPVTLRSPTADISGGQPEQKTSVKLNVTLPPVSPSDPRGGLFASRVADSPTKSHSSLFFPPPASPPPFTPYPTTTAHTSESINSTPVKFQNDTSGSNLGLPPNTRARRLAFPSAVPLAGGPFLATSPPEGELALGSKTAAGVLNDAEYLGANLTSPLGFLAPPTSPLGIIPRKRAAKTRTGPLGSRAKVTKTSNRKSNYPARSRKQPVSHVTSTSLLSSSLLPSDPLLAPTYESFFSSFGHEASQPGAESDSDMALPTLATDDAGDGPFAQEGAGWSTPVNSHSYTNPSTTLRSMLPTPSLTSASFATPFSMNLATPDGNHLFPSPDIVSSPLLSESRPIRGRGRRQRMMTAYASPTRFDPESLGAQDLVEGSGTGFSRLPPTGKLVGGALERGESGEVSDECNQNVPSGEGSRSFAKLVHDTLSDQGSQEHQNPREECHQLDITPKQEDIPLGLPCIDVENAPASTIDPSSICVRNPEAPSTLGKRSRGTDADDDRPGAKLPKENGGSRISTDAETGGNDVQSEPTRRGIYFERPTRPQSRAAAALLELAASRPKPATPTGAKVETLAIKRENSAIRSTTRSTTLATSVHTPAPKKVSRQPAPRAKRGVIGRAPSRVSALATSPPLEDIRRTPDSDAGLSMGSDLKPFISAPIGASKVVDEARLEEFDDETPLTKPTPKTHSIPSELLPRPDPTVVFGSDGQIIRRTFPEGFPINLRYPKWYCRFPVSAFFMKGDPVRDFVLGEGAVIATPRNGPRSMVPNQASYLNLYTPRFVHGVGADKVGLCPICIEPVWRGGEGRTALFNTKISAYSKRFTLYCRATFLQTEDYHMQYYHGISPRTGLPFSPPVAFQHRKRQPWQIKKLERRAIEEGQCHVCFKWILIESVKELDIMVPELYWWKHAASCHGASHLPQDQGRYIEDNVYLRLQEYIRQLEAEEDQPAGEIDVGHLNVNIGGQNTAAVQSSSRATQAEEENQDGTFIEELESESDLTDLEDKDLDQ